MSVRVIPLGLSTLVVLPSDHITRSGLVCCSFPRRNEQLTARYQAISLSFSSSCKTGASQFRSSYYTAGVHKSFTPPCSQRLKVSWISCECLKCPRCSQVIKNPSEESRAPGFSCMCPLQQQLRALRQFCSEAWLRVSLPLSPAATAAMSA